MSDHEDSQMPDPYDRLLGALHGLPDVVHCKPSTIRTVTPLLGHSNTYIVQTYRQREQGDTVLAAQPAPAPRGPDGDAKESE